MNELFPYLKEQFRLEDIDNETEKIFAEIKKNTEKLDELIFKIKEQKKLYEILKFDIENNRKFLIKNSLADILNKLVDDLRKQKDFDEMQRILEKINKLKHNQNSIFPLYEKNSLEILKNQIFQN